ncbi:outer membrane protein assembly factor BamA, partial [bacterium]|nr:outer membrane protein assembly factor BamA [bacterium]
MILSFRKKRFIPILSALVCTTLCFAKPETRKINQPDTHSIFEEKNPKPPQQKKVLSPKTSKKEKEIPQETEPSPILSNRSSRIIRNITISGSTMVPDEVILSRVPYKQGEPFNPNKTKKLINNLYYDLKRFRNITVLGDHINNDQIDIHIKVEEKNPLKTIEFVGNNKFSKKDIEKKIDFSNIPAIDEEELLIYAQKIKKLYLEKNYHAATVNSKLEIDPKDKKGIAIFTVDEGKKSMVKRVMFTGNKNISSKELRSKIFTREDWPLSFLDNSGSYQPERIEGDRHLIEQYYQNNGYMMAKVVNVDVVINPDSKHFNITFDVNEGDIFTIKEVKASGNEIFKDDYLSSRLPIKEGDLYSRESIVNSIKALEGLWGEMGYIYAHINPSIQPDEETKTVNLAFHTELGNKVFLNKINIIGNKKTRDKVIRRKLALSEGQILTNSRMDSSKNRVEGLGFFDQKDGVIWRKTRVDDEHADLDLIIKEIKTGKAHLKFGFGGAGTSLKNPSSGFSVGAEIADTNLFGTGIQTMLNASWAKGQQSILFNLTDPWLFDLPITGAVDVYHKRPSYDDFKNTQAVNEKLTGGGATLGFVSRTLLDTQVMFRLGIDKVVYEKKPVASLNRSCLSNIITNQVLAQQQYQSTLDKLFTPGTYFWVATHLGMDRKNHPMHPSRGYKWMAVYQAGIPSFNCNVGFHKFDLDLNWYTPLIGERDLVLRL